MNTYSHIARWTLCLLAAAVLWGCAAKDEMSQANENADVAKMAPEPISTEEAGEAFSFSDEDLDEHSLNAFDIKGMQKVRDFAELVSIITDPELDISFRNKATEMAEALFVSNRSMIRLPGFDNRDELSVMDSLGRIDQVLKLEIDTLWVSRGLRPDRYGAGYNGTIGFQCTWKWGEESIPYEGRATIRADKFIKQFGAEEQEIWEVRLERFMLDF